MKKDYKALHQESLVADLHCDTIIQVKRGYDLSEKHDSYHIDIPRLKEGGVDFQAFALYLSTSTPKNECFQYVDRILQILKSELNKHSDLTAICTSKSEADQIINSGKIAALLAIENGAAIESSLDNLDYFYEQGIRYITLTHSGSHDWCSSSSDKGADEFGLTGFGKDVIRKMNDLNMIVDVSHISVKAFNDVLDTTSQPVIASHSNAHDLCSHDRNLTDEQLKALADKGGVVGMNFCPVFLSDGNKEVTERFIKSNMELFNKSNDLDLLFLSEDEYQKRAQEYKPFFNEYRRLIEPYKVDYKTVVDHIDYIVDLIGDDFVALGSDFDGIGSTPVGLENCSKFPNITKELFERGYSENSIKKILGLNFMRVFEAVCG